MLVNILIKEMRAYFENHETCTKEDAQKIENNTIRKFNLKNKYSFLNPNEEQKKTDNYQSRKSRKH